MGFRRQGKEEHTERKSWEAWLEANADLIPKCGFPPGVFRSRGDWEYLLEKGYWCEYWYGAFITNIDYSLDDLTPVQAEAYKELLERTLSDEQKSGGSAGWSIANRHNDS